MTDTFLTFGLRLNDKDFMTFRPRWDSAGWWRFVEAFSKEASNTDLFWPWLPGHRS